MSELYEPCEDTFLLASALQKYQLGKVLDIGTGTGYLAMIAAKKAKSVLAVDKNPKAVAYCKKKYKMHNVIFRQSDLFSHVHGKYDTIIFNPPYLPYDWREPKSSQLATTGGKHGYELLVRFINESPAYLESTGRILIVFSSLTNKQKIDECILCNMLEKKVVAAKKIPFEELYVYCIRKSALRQRLEKSGVKRLAFYAKGKRGLVFAGTLGKKKIAIKIHHPESHAQNALANEAKMLHRANKLGIGPLLLKRGNGFATYQFAEGEPFDDILHQLSRKQILSVLSDIIRQAHKLDEAGIAKEEMSNPYKHIIITPNITTPKPVLIDFERAHMTKKAHNVTQLSSYLLRLHSRLQKKRIVFSKEDVIEWARQYAARKQHINKLLQILRP